MPKPMPKLLRCVLCPKAKISVIEYTYTMRTVYMSYGHKKWPENNRVVIETKAYKTERGARNSWNRLMRKMMEG